MDLSMILSPAVEDEEDASLSPPNEPNRNWSSDELQCAVAILQDFQQPPTKSRLVPQTRYYAATEEPHNIKPSIQRLDNEGAGKENKKEDASNVVTTRVWGDDSMSKLDLLVEADAVIKRRRPKKSTGDSPQCLRSGVWSRAEEEYAAALVSYFLQGLLDLPEGTTLRKFLAEKLCCNRRRVSMKLGTESLAGQKIPRKVGASVFVAAQPPPCEEDLEEVERVLEELRDICFSFGLESGRYIGREGDYHLFADEYEDYGLKRGQGHKPKRGKPTIIRTGFESLEEEEFVTAMVEFFMAGVLDLPEGSKLVHYLCQQLDCTPKQLSMKLAPQHMGEHKFPENIGSITYQRKESGDASPASLDDDDFSEELFEVESRLTELRLAHEEAHKNAPPPVVTPVKRERKSSTASVSSIGTVSVASTPSASPVRSFRRSGPWSHDEEVYAAALIDCFFKGVLDIAEGTTLRAFLSSRLCCNPMRISKKLSSESIAEIRIPKKLGSSTYVLRAEVSPEKQAETEEALRILQYTYLHSSGSRKRPRSSRSQSRPAIAPLGLDYSDDAESDSDNHSTALSRTHGMNLEKLQKTEKATSPAQEAHRQQLQVLHTSPQVVALKEQLA